MRWPVYGCGNAALRAVHSVVLARLNFASDHEAKAPWESRPPGPRMAPMSPVQRSEIQSDDWWTDCGAASAQVSLCRNPDLNRLASMCVQCLDPALVAIMTMLRHQARQRRRPLPR